jgi:hypothetical protein
MVVSQHELSWFMYLVLPRNAGLIPRKPDRHSPDPGRTFADVPKLRKSHPFRLAAASLIEFTTARWI